MDTEENKPVTGSAGQDPSFDEVSKESRANESPRTDTPKGADPEKITSPRNDSNIRSTDRGRLPGDQQSMEEGDNEMNVQRDKKHKK
jgi:hypothetical protein